MAEKRTKQRTPALEWVAAAIGLLLTLAVLGILAREALSGARHDVPMIAVTVERVIEREGQFLVEVKATNRTGAAASHVEIEGRLTPDGGGEPITGKATVDYVPGHSGRKAGLFFSADPRRGQLEVRALGYEEP